MPISILIPSVIINLVLIILAVKRRKKFLDILDHYICKSCNTKYYVRKKITLFCDNCNCQYSLIVNSNYVMYNDNFNIPIQIIYFINNDIVISNKDYNIIIFDYNYFKNNKKEDYVIIYDNESIIKIETSDNIKYYTLFEINVNKFVEINYLIKNDNKKLLNKLEAENLMKKYKKLHNIL